MENFITVTKGVYFRGGVIHDMGFLKRRFFSSVFKTIRVQCVAYSNRFHNANRDGLDCLYDIIESENLRLRPSPRIK